jgi:hypothetical protein
MKQLLKLANIKAVLVILFLSLMQTLSLAQDGGGKTVTKTTTHTETQTWYLQPWAWVVGGAVFIIIIIALVRGGRSDRVTITKTSTTDTNV